MSAEKESINLQKCSPDELMVLGNKAKETGDVENAIKYFEMAGKAGNTDGYAEIGSMYQYGEGVELSHAKALSWHQKVIDAGDMDGYWLKGNTYREMEDYNAAAECYEIAFEKACNSKKYAAYDLAMAYHYGVGKEENFAKALELYHLAAENGADLAMLALGKLFQYGDIVQEDHESALYWYEKAKEAGNEDAEEYIKLNEIDEYLILGSYSMETKDYDTALKAYNAAADMGSIDAMVCLGDIYNEGFACRRNPELSFEFFQKAADAGNSEGMYGLAQAYGCGYGVNIDGEKALEWFEKAAEAGSYKAMMDLADSFIRAGTYIGEFYDMLKENEVFIGNAVVTRPVDEDKALYWYQEALKTLEEYGDKDLLADKYRKVSKDINMYCKSTKLKSFADECIKKRRTLLTGITDE